MTKEELKKEIIEILREEMISDGLKYISYDRFLVISGKIIKLIKPFLKDEDKD